MRSLNYFLIAIFSLLNSCDTDKSQTPDIYNFLLTQPDGSIPDSGYAVVYEKQLDPVTGFNTVSIPVSDTIRWNNHEFSWVDNRENGARPLLIKTYSPDEYTPPQERSLTVNIENENCDLFFPQARPVEVLIRQSEPFPSEVRAWGIIVTPSPNPLTEVDGASSVALSQFNSFESVSTNRVILKAEILFNEFNTLYCHLFRFDGSVWHEDRILEADILSTEGKFKFNIEHSLSCYE